MEKQSSSTILLNEDDKKQLYNRQEYVVGAETQRKYGMTDVLVVGLSGLGSEIVKNIVLTGVRSVTIVDNQPIQWDDLSSLFYATEEDIGKPRAQTLESHFAELNRFVPVKTHVGAVTEDLIKSHHVVCFCDKFTTQLTQENEWARKNGVKFVCTECRGVTGCIFVDGGDKLTILDTNGEECPTCIVVGITSDGVIMCHEDKKHECVEGDLVYFTKIEGPEVLNSPSHENPKYYKVKKLCGPFMLEIEAPELVGAAAFTGRGGYLHTTKQHVEVKFKPLKEAMVEPEFTFLDDDAEKFTAPTTLHTMYQVLHSSGKIPEPTDKAALEGVVEKIIQTDPACPKITDSQKQDADQIAEFKKQYQKYEKLVLNLVMVAKGNLNPLVSFFGGLASQEVLKVVSGKFTPIQQWLYYDVRELLTCRGDVPLSDLKPQGCRYDGAIRILGQALNEKLVNESGFIVGAGALGCEFIKNFACMGIGCGENSCLHITDMDRIELSNLSRQFLFRTKHIGKPKSTVAASVAKHINKNLKVIGMEEKVGPDTETIFTEEFWKSKGIICNALDNVEARKYVDMKCVFFQRPLFESGTRGTMCNSQDVIPYLTESYSSSYDPPEKTIPLCTLKNFPNAIEHTIQWARDAFERYFVNEPQDINGYLHDSNFLPNLNKDPGNKPAVFASIMANISEAPKTAEDCVSWARVQFEEMFANIPKQLLHNLPLDKVGENGQPFWAGAKRPPCAICFSADNKFHMDFIKAAAALRAFTYKLSLKGIADEQITQICGNTKVPQFQPVVVKVALTENDKTDGTTLLKQVAPLTEEQLPSISKNKSLTLEVAEFEKDDDNNFHMDFITACSNLRATNYCIPTEDKIRTKFIAGKIIPAMVTTTALVCGLVGLEILKWVMNCKDLNLYKNAFVNIALPYVGFTTPMEPKTTEYVAPSGAVKHWSLWDRFDIDEGKEVTLTELVELVKIRHEVVPNSIATEDGKLLYCLWNLKKDRMAMPVSKVMEDVQKKELPREIKHLTLIIVPDEDVELPVIRYRFRW